LATGKQLKIIGLKGGIFVIFIIKILLEEVEPPLL